ncbi:uncharacterized protein LOC143578542 [Bidens hawaiensis]|uniref:uncharacterized protein LOC143578542 n=1 Tax=Bidens hawaiensis TaxID=980011 RepID=UPI00404B9820
MKLKTSELFCASPASTAICTTMNHHAMVRRGGPRSGGSTPKPLNHHHHRHHNYYNNHYQFDFGDKPKFKAPAIPCTSQQHIDPKPFASYLQESRKSTSSAYSTTRKNNDHLQARRKSSAELNDRSNSSGSSSRYLLHDRGIKDNDYVCNTGVLVVSEQIWPDDHDDHIPVVKKSLSSRGSCRDDSPALVKARSSSVRLHSGVDSPGSKSLRPRSHNQVVELRVSIHCKGCEGKVRKHISRMEGVKSFQIDLESKKVTVVGDITPLSVLSSISKVKNAQLWPSHPSSSTSSPSPLIAIRY